MKRYILSFVLSLTAISSPAFAWVGGPFDNGFHSAALERNSVYQATFRLLNGSGFCYFSPTAEIGPEAAVSTTVFDMRGSIRNRAVVYYKGVTYVGSAFGTVDAEANFVECEMNGSSELAIQTQNQNNGNNNANFFAASSNAAAVLGNVVASNRSFTFNGAFEGQITQIAPSFRFTGKGELVFLSPTSQDSVAGLAFTSYSGLISAILSFIGGSSVQPATGNGTVSLGTIFTDAQTTIANILTDLGTTWLGKGGIDSTMQNGVRQVIHVTGTRRYL